MLLESADSLQGVISLVGAIHAQGANTIGALLFVVTYMTVIMYLLWRSWTFTLQPILRPKDPQELPYWIPCKFDALLRKPNAFLAR